MQTRSFRPRLSLRPLDNGIPHIVRPPHALLERLYRPTSLDCRPLCSWRRESRPSEQLIPLRHELQLIGNHDVESNSRPFATLIESLLKFAAMGSKSKAEGCGYGYGTTKQLSGCPNRGLLRCILMAGGPWRWKSFCDYKGHYSSINPGKLVDKAAVAGVL